MTSPRELEDNVVTIFTLLSFCRRVAGGTKAESVGKACGRLDLLEKATQGEVGCFT